MKFTSALTLGLASTTAAAPVLNVRQQNNTLTDSIIQWTYDIQASISSKFIA
jgi:hypothetical protein